MIPLGLLFGLGLLRADWWGQTFQKWPPPEEHILINIPQSFSSSVLPQQEAAVNPCFSRRSSENCSQVQHRFPLSLCFALGPCIHKSLHVPFKNGVSISPNPVELLCTSPTGLECQILWELFLSMPDPQVWAPDVGLRILTPIGESL